MTPDEDAASHTVAAAIADYLSGQGVERVFSLPGSHMKPIWAELAGRGVRVVTARHEVAAVHMAQAEADLRHRLAVAIVTTGPGLTNAVTGIGCAFLAGSPVLVISTRPPDEQAGMGALEEIDQAAIVAPVCRSVEVVRSPRHVVDRLDRAVSAALGDDGPGGPVYVEFGTELLRRPAAPPYTAYPRRTRAPRPPEPGAVERAADAIAASTRPLVLAGREALTVPGLLAQFVRATGAVYLDTRASRGAMSESLASFVPAARARAMAEADLVITIGRQLDFEVAYGSPAVFRAAEGFLRIGRNSEEVLANRRGDVELRADPRSALEALLTAGATPAAPDHHWRDDLVRTNAGKRRRLAETMRTQPAAAGGLHPYQVIRALNEHLDDAAIVIVDGGDILSWSRSSLKTPTYLDLGPFGCLGVGVPFAVSASLNHPDRTVVALVGDGALGFNVMELETAVREGARFVVVVADNNAWNIERADQLQHYQGNVLGTELGPCAWDRLAESLGVAGYRAGTADELSAALEEAFAHAPALVAVSVSREPVSPDTRSGLALVPEYHALAAWDEAERTWLSGRADREG
ncbi:thiamine pyrophosphate-binding protein [Jiangella alkaliphila]|uniref:Acetolactate synthase-1/2/3 large subunit n=1 Tax=Jiangella alkaliphila TaxID=419479 RepID=A0A1H2IS28_9ACTN|nr:thiamine pyrophosphate-binding protein [Jiangella alkaliphila]SDU46775.1 acetolactate synthase-1/2/3 large subunit [Jiangella alkaliphila]